MKTIYLAAAALLLAGSAAQAGSSIALDVGGHKVRVTMPSNCQSLSCLQVSGINLKGLKTGSSSDDDDSTVNSQPAPPAPAPVATAPVAPAPAVAMPAPQVATTQPPAPTVTSTMPAPVPAPVAVAATAPVAPDAAPAPSPSVAAPQAPAAQPAPAPAANTPVGLWATENHKGNVRIEPCGDNLCGFAEKTGEKILINMKPKDSKWVGRIHDPEGGSNYDSTIALKGPDTLKVQGCAFGGLFCGGQTWKRVG